MAAHAASPYSGSPSRRATAATSSSSRGSCASRVSVAIEASGDKPRQVRAFSQITPRIYSSDRKGGERVE
eukprot:6184703-Pleurochrysis_carterae.AAC.1